MKVSKKIKHMIKIAKKMVRGFTLVELLVAMAIIALLSSVVLANFRQGNKSKSVTLGVDSVTSAMRTAQSASLTGNQISAFNCAQGNQASEYRLKFTAGSPTYSLLAYDKCGNPPITLETYQLSQNVIVSPTGLKITDQGNGTTTANSTLEFKFVPPFAKTLVSKDGGTFIAFKTGALDIESSDSQIIKKVSLDGLSGRVDTKVITLDGTISPSEPNVPLNLTAVSGVASITLNWQAPDNDGGSPVIGYNIYRSNSSNSETLFGTSSTTTFLDSVPNNVAYFYKVTVTNSVGESSQSNEASEVAAPIRKGGVTFKSGENGLGAVAVSGSYAYTITNSALVVTNVSNPSAPTRVTALDLTSYGPARGMTISGHYIYYPTYGTSPTKLAIIDISNPAAPTKVAALPLNSNEQWAVQISVIGNYAYVLGSLAPAVLTIVDVSNPAAPVRTGAVTLNSGEDTSCCGSFQGGLSVSGQYAYISTSPHTPSDPFSPAASALVVVDVSNPALPLRIGAVTLGSTETSSRANVVSGNYVYISSDTSPAKLTIVDVSNPTAPVRVGGVTLNSGEDGARSMSISGKYVFISTSEESPGKMVMVDVSNPSNPTRIASVTLNAGENTPRATFVLGRYVYVVSNTSPARLVVIDKGL